MDYRHMFFALMAHTLTWKDVETVDCATLDTDVLVLEWKHLKYVPMEHTATQLVLESVFCAQKALGEPLI